MAMMNSLPLFMAPMIAPTKLIAMSIRMLGRAIWRTLPRMPAPSISAAS